MNFGRAPILWYRAQAIREERYRDELLPGTPGSQTASSLTTAVRYPGEHRKGPKVLGEASRIEEDRSRVWSANVKGGGQMTPMRGMGTGMAAMV